MKKTDIFSIVLILGMFLFSLYLWPQLPDRVPTHWGPNGKIDNYGSKYVGLFLFPFMSLIVYLIMILIPKISVFKENMKKFAFHYHIFKGVFIFFFTLLYAITLLPNFGYVYNINYFIIPLISFLFFYLGIFLSKCKRNFFVGIRTPWTLSSDEVWDKTHHLGSVTFRAIAIIMLFGIFFHEYFIAIIIVPIIANTILLFVYSYWLYNKLRKKPKL